MPRTLPIRLDEELFKFVESESKKDSRSMSNYVSFLIMKEKNRVMPPGYIAPQIPVADDDDESWD